MDAGVRVNHTATGIYVHARCTHMVASPAQLSSQLIVSGTRAGERNIKSNRIGIVEIKAAQRDPSKAVAIELEPNQCSLHDGRIIHGSEPNTSSIRRCGYTMRYISTRVRENHEQVGQWHHLYLARGKDHAGNVYGDPAKAYPDLARFRVKHGKNGH